ncbi:MAG: hypothetical protein RIG77_17980, partial [Cyclobacteriaceae bacterium]
TECHTGSNYRYIMPTALNHYRTLLVKNVQVGAINTECMLNPISQKFLRWILVGDLNSTTYRKKRKGFPVGIE